MRSALQDRDEVIVSSLSSILVQGGPLVDNALQAALARYSNDNSKHWLLYTPAAARNGNGLQVATLSSWIPARQSDRELDEKVRREIIDGVATSCSPGVSRRPPSEAGTTSPIISILPVPALQGCWLLISADFNPAALAAFADTPFWRSRTVWVGLLVYVLAAAVTLMVIFDVLRRLRQFGDVADDIAQRRGASQPPAGRAAVASELVVAKGVIESLVADIRRMSEQISHTAADNAHSYKSPLAVIKTAVGRVRRHVPTTQDNVHRALHAADQAIDRLFLLVTASHRLDDDTAALLVAPRHLIDLSRLIDEAVQQAHELMSIRSLRLVRRVDDGVMVRAGLGNLETVLRNVIDNAIAASPDGGVIVITLTRKETHVSLEVDDEGPGVPADEIGRVFERDYPGPSYDLRPGEKNAEHARPGLFVVKRNIESLGGEIAATNRSTRGLSVSITLPAPRQ